MPQDKEPIPKFAARIKAKYPQYKDMDDTLLTKSIITKYPEYGDMVDFTEEVKKKEPSSLGSLGGGIASVLPSKVPSKSQNPIEELDFNIRESYKSNKPFNYTMGIIAPVKDFDVSKINLDDDAELSKAITKLTDARFLAADDKEVASTRVLGYSVDKKERELMKRKDDLLGMLQTRMLYNKSQREMSSDVASRYDKILKAVTKANMRKEAGENIKTEDLFKEGFDADKSATIHLMRGIDFVKDANPGKYKNVIRLLDDKGEVADTDFEQLSDIGQQVENVAIQTGKQPGVETSIVYIGTSYQSKKSEAARKIGEIIKKEVPEFMRGGNYDKNLIREAAKRAGVDNKEIIDDLILEEKLVGYDAIPKSGTIETLVRGVKSPFEGIKRTVDNAFKSDSEIYLQSQNLDVGGRQLVSDEKGKLGGELPTDRGNIWYDAVEGFSQFIPQVLLTKGIGGIGAKALASQIPARAALNASQLSNLTNVLGTLPSVYFQEYGNAYEDALNKTGSHKLARTMGAINAASAAGFELFLPDAKIADKAAGIFRSKYANDIVDLFRSGKDLSTLAKSGRPLIQKFVNEVGGIMKQEIKEELATNITNYITESIFSPTTAKKRDLGTELAETAKATAIQMLIPAILGGAGSSKSDFTQNGLHLAAINLDDSKKALSRLLADGSLTQKENDKIVSVLQTHRDNLHSMEDDGNTEFDEVFQKTVNDIKGQSQETKVELPVPKEATILKKSVSEGRITGVYAELVEQGREDDVLKDISQQAQNITSDGQPSTLSSPEQSMQRAIETFGEDVVNEAIKMFPATEPSLPSPTEQTSTGKVSEDVKVGGDNVGKAREVVKAVEKEVKEKYGYELGPDQVSNREIFSKIPDEYRERYQKAITDLGKAVVGVEKQKEPPLSSKEVAEESKDVAEALRVYEEESTNMYSLAEDIREIVSETGDKNLQDALNYFDNEIQYDRTISGRHDMDMVDKEFVRRVKESLEPTTKTSPTNETKLNPKATEESIESNEPVASEKEILADAGLTEESKAAAEGTGEPPIPPKEEVVEEVFENSPKAILNRVHKSTNISKEHKERFEQHGLTYDPQSHEVARIVATEIVDEFGTDDAVSMAEAGRFGGDVNSMIFAEAIDRTYEQEQAATSQKEKIKLAEKWADFAIRYDESARSKGRFISAIFDFYKKSPLGVMMAEKSKRDAQFKEWFKGKDKSYKEVFEAIKDDPEFKEFVKEKVETQLKQERTVARMKQKDKISKFFDKAKIKKDGFNSSLIPPPIWNAAVEVMKQAWLLGESIADTIKKGVDYIKDNHADAWDEDAFRVELENKLKGMDAVKGPLTTEEKQQRLLDRFRKKLKGLSEDEKAEVIRRSFRKLVENGALEYDDFKKIIAEVIGLGEMSKEEAEKLQGYVKDINAVQDAADNVLKEETKESISKFDAAAKKAEKSSTKLAAILNNKPNLGGRIRALIQLNTLGVVSLIKNPVYNVWHQILVRFPKAVFGTILDQAIYGTSLLANGVFGSPIIKPDVNVLLAQKGYFSKGAVGGVQAVKQVFTGLTNKDYFQKEVYTSQIKPFHSWRDLYMWWTGKKHLSGEQITDKLLQGLPIPGMSAEIVARMLNIGDKPFRFAAEAAIAETIATTEFKLKGMERQVFLRFPKEKALKIYKAKGLSEEDAAKKAEAIEKRIIEEGEQAVFQQSNIISDAINGMKQKLSSVDSTNNPTSGAISGIAKILGTLNMPFVKTPLNLAWEIFNLANPEIALLQSFVYGIRAIKNKSKSDYIQSKKWMAHAATGLALLAAAAYLASIGAVTGDDEDEPYKEKETKGKGTYQKPKRINISKVWRAATGGTTEDQDGDINVDWSWFGASGVIANMQANKYENMTKEEREEMTYVEDLLRRMRTSAQDGLLNSVFQGSLTAVEALRTGKADQWLLGMMNVGANLIEPATISQISRATRPYDFSLSGEDFNEKLKKTIRSRFFGKVQPKVNIWGEPMKREGSGGDVALRMLGISKTDTDQFANAIHQDFKRTGDAGFYPLAISPKFTIEGKQISLNTEQAFQYESLVGLARKNLAAPFVNNMATLSIGGEDKKYKDLKDAEKKELLGKIYDAGRDLGKAQFLQLHPELLKQ